MITRGPHREALPTTATLILGDPNRKLKAQQGDWVHKPQCPNRTTSLEGGAGPFPSRAWPYQLSMTPHPTLKLCWSSYYGLSLLWALDTTGWHLGPRPVAEPLGCTPMAQEPLLQTISMCPGFDCSMCGKNGAAFQVFSDREPRLPASF